jgi:hypothetical protein
MTRRMSEIMQNEFGRENAKGIMAENENTSMSLNLYSSEMTCGAPTQYP